MNQTLFYYVLSFFLFFSLSSFPSNSFAKETAQKSYKNARSCYYSLKGSREKQVDKRNWSRCIKKFLLVYKKYPNSTLADDALFSLGIVYSDIFKRFARAKDLNLAIHYYKTVAEKYPGSRLADDAMFRVGEIRFYNLKKYAEAQNAYTEVIKNFPKGDMYKPALKRLKALSAFHKKTNTPDKQKKIKVTGIRHHNYPEYTRIVIELENKIRFKEHRVKNPERIYIDLYSAVIDEKLKNNPIRINNQLLKRVRVSQYQPNIARVVLDVNNHSFFKIFSYKNPFRIVIDLSDKSELINNFQTAASNTGANKIIVIDPGHGGKDRGARGTKGLTEKEVVLDISLKLKKIIEKNLGYKVILTRDGDTYVSLKERTAIANSNNADLFVSIHANASKRKNVSGIETYYLDFAKSDQALETATRENETPFLNIRDDVQYILADMVANTKMNESSQFAGIVQNSLIKGLQKKYHRVRNLKAKGGPFYVLYGANMPSILVETSFISNPAEEKRLKSKKYRESLAYYILKGIERYFKEIQVAYNTK